MGSSEWLADIGSKWAGWQMGDEQVERQVGLTGGGVVRFGVPNYFGSMYYIVLPTPTDLFKKSLVNSPVNKKLSNNDC